MYRLSLLVCCILFACTNNIPEQECYGLLSIDLNDPESRAAGAYTTNDSELKQLYMYIFDSRTESLEAVHQATTEELSLGKITLLHPAGTKHIHIIANPPTEEISKLQRIEYFNDIATQTTDLKNLSAESFSMAGTLFNVVFDPTQTSQETATLERNAARLHLQEIQNLYTEDFLLDSIYFLDAVPSSSFYDCTSSTQTAKYDKMLSEFKFQNYDIFTEPQRIAAGGNLTDITPEGTHYYLFENTSNDDPTSLVITGKIGCDRVYYSTALIGTSALIHNHHYDITITITDRGTPTPEVDIFGCDAQITIKEWQETNNLVEY